MSRMFKVTDPDFPTTKAAQDRLYAMGRVERSPQPPPARPYLQAVPALVAASPRLSAVDPIVLPPSGPTIMLGAGERAPMHVDLQKLMAGRMLVQGSSGAGKSTLLRLIVEQAHEHLTTIMVDPEGEFGNLAEHIGAATILAASVAGDGLTQAALGARKHRVPLHLDLSDLEPDQRILKAAAFFAGLLSSPREDWGNTVLVVVDEAHLLAPHLAASARDAETRRLGVATLTELCSRGRKRGIATVVATQRLAKLATSVVSELHNVALGINVFDRDIARGADLLGWTYDKAATMRDLAAGQFLMMGPAICPLPQLCHVGATVTRHVGKTPDLLPSAGLGRAGGAALLQIDQLAGEPGPGRVQERRGGHRALDGFLLDPAAPVAGRIVEALARISPNATSCADLVRHLGSEVDLVNAALDLLAGIGAVDTTPKGDGRIARLAARLRLRIADMPVVGLA